MHFNLTCLIKVKYSGTSCFLNMVHVLIVIQTMAILANYLYSHITENLTARTNEVVSLNTSSLYDIDIVFSCSFFQETPTVAVITPSGSEQPERPDLDLDKQYPTRSLPLHASYLSVLNQVAARGNAFVEKRSGCRYRISKYLCCYS